jgi:hypothetical protein
MTPKEILEIAIKKVTKEKADAYGDYNAMFKNVAQLWATYFGYKVSPRDVCHCMTLLKIARDKLGKDDDDNFIDACGYEALASACKQDNVVPDIFHNITALKGNVVNDLKKTKTQVKEDLVDARPSDTE